MFNTPQDFSLFFLFSGLSGDIIGDLAAGGGGFPSLPSNWIIDWRRFHELGASGGAPVTVQPSRKLDPYLVAALHNLPGGGGNLAFRNLKRGVNLGLPSGQAVAKHHPKVKNPLTPAEIASDSSGSTDGAVAKAQGLPYGDPALVLHPQGSEGPQQWRAPRPGRLDDHLRGLRRPRPRRP